MIPIKVGIIGFGNFGKVHYDAIVNRLDTELIWICDIKQPKLDDNRISFFFNIEDAIRHSNIEACIIATPEATHYDLAKAMLNNNIHVYVEKPMSMRYIDAKELIETAKLKRKQLFVGHSLRKDPFFVKLKDNNGKSQKGNLRRIRFERLYADKYWNEYTKVHPVFSLSIHDIDLANWLFDDRSRFIRTQNLYDNKNSFIGFQSMVEYKRNNLLEISCSKDDRNSNEGLRLKIVLEWDNDSKTILKYFKFGSSGLDKLNKLVVETQDSFFSNIYSSEFNYKILEEHADAVKTSELIAKELS